MKRLLIPALIAIASWAVLVPVPAAANQPRLDSTHGDWTVYTRGNGAAKTCYAVSRPTALSPETVRHGDVFFLVSNWANGDATEQPSLMTGFPLKPARSPMARVGSTGVNMYGAENEAFIAEDADERRLVKQMRAGANMTVEAVSERGTEVTYNFSLKGVTAALRKSRSLCG
ncbi:invasion associated locus B family protein [uncultured Algimonas sp.]|uniref:invasion associated locus B family protein n=1 Tax=uncultured Algimonas sp. TaxID=1547920 RepID=UPI00262C75AF|nr:invasion associated locus B family protein [uncultured Algimonas sp.]